MFETETMAELCVQQGLLDEAAEIYRRLVASAPDEITGARRRQRLGELERQGSGAAKSESAPSASPVGPPKVGAKVGAKAAPKLGPRVVPKPVVPPPAAPAPAAPDPLPLPGVHATWD